MNAPLPNPHEFAHEFQPGSAPAFRDCYVCGRPEGDLIHGNDCWPADVELANAVDRYAKEHGPALTLSFVTSYLCDWKLFGKE